MWWVRLDDDFPNHPKVVGLSDAAFRAYVQGLCYCSQYLTDGWLPARPGDRRAAGELVKAHLWVPDGEGFQVHDYLDHQQSREQVNARRQQARNAANRRWKREP